MFNITPLTSEHQNWRHLIELEAHQSCHIRDFVIVYLVSAKSDLPSLCKMTVYVGKREVGK